MSRLIFAIAAFFLFSGLSPAYAIVLNVPESIEKELVKESATFVATTTLLEKKTKFKAKLKELTKDFHARPTITLPAFKIYKSKKENTKADVAVMSGIGGGLAFVKYDTSDSDVHQKDGEVDVSSLKTKVSLSPATILLNKELDDNSINIAYAVTAGFFNDLLMVGAGYDLGHVEDQHRFFLLLSIGTTF